MKEADPKETSRAVAYDLWMKAPNPMVTITKTIDVTNLVKISRKQNKKFNMLLDYCIGKAAKPIEEFYLLPVNDKLYQFDELAINTIVKNVHQCISSCDMAFHEKLSEFELEYLKYTQEAAKNATDRNLDDHMVIGTSAMIETEIDSVIGMNSGIYNNPFLFWGKYRKKWFTYYLPISFQFHHTQMDGSHAACFLENLQNEIKSLAIDLD